MFEVRITVNCPSKVVKNGKKKNGAQNLLCRSCGKLVLPLYKNRGAAPAVKGLILRLLERNSGIRDIESLLPR